MQWAGRTLLRNQRRRRLAALHHETWPFSGCSGGRASSTAVRVVILAFRHSDGRARRLAAQAVPKRVAAADQRWPAQSPHDLQPRQQEAAAARNPTVGRASCPSLFSSPSSVAAHPLWRRTGRPSHIQRLLRGSMQDWATGRVAMPRNRARSPAPERRPSPPCHTAAHRAALQANVPGHAAGDSSPLPPPSSLVTGKRTPSRGSRP